MDDNLKNLLAELETFGIENDIDVTERSRRMLNITRDTGEFLRVLVLSTRASNILELGTSNGYSTIWLADAASAIGGKVTTLELELAKVDMARTNFERAGLAQYIEQIHSDGGSFLRDAATESYDLVFLDSKRSEYPNWQADLKRVLRKGGLLVVDNAVSHADQMTSFTQAIEADPEFATSLVPVGKGEFLAHRLR
jgi:predicted O-methyltransferase YrrM